MSARCYTIAEILALLKMPRRTFFELRKAGEIPCLEELRPRIGRRVRYRADLIDRYLANQWRLAPAILAPGARRVAKARLRPVSPPDPEIADAS